MAKEWTDDEVQALISDSVRIVREDRFESFVRSRIGQTPPTDQNGEGDKSGNGNGNGGSNPPPTGEPAQKRRSLFWGEVD